MKRLLLFFVLFLTPGMELCLFASSSSGEGVSLFYHDTILCSECAGTAYLYDIDISF